MNPTGTIKDMLKEERPYEKCERYGAEHLTDIELLAVFLRSGTKGENSLAVAKELLYPAHGSPGIINIHRYTMEQLLQIHGIGKVKAIQIRCLSELAKRLSRAEAVKGLCFDRPESIANYYMEDMRHHGQEILKLLMLNTKSRLIGETMISKGTVNAAVISPRELLIEALQKNAVSIILMHNHPSGDPTPSREDILITRRVKEAGALIGIELLDHIVIGNHSYVSFAEKGLL
ncbi:MAG TPA: hypothetical protein DCZ20_04170 [Lachnospiraceae bacterium]|nr:hypothetical protein [Lachnospiraceae bacterium]